MGRVRRAHRRWRNRGGGSFPNSRQTGAQVEEDSFTASTPIGAIPMTNIVAKFPGTQTKVVMVTGHYDTKRFDAFKFVGANDGGSSAALLLELARDLQGRKQS